jgi:hypothetical protein
MAQVKQHAGKIGPNGTWIACGTLKGMKDAHGGVTTVADFKKLPVEQQCQKCAARIKLLKL